MTGRGGEHTADPRLRKCGWAWVQHASLHEFGEYGAFGGVQTVPRAEVQALRAALSALIRCDTPSERVDIYTDNKMVHTRANALLAGHTPTGGHGDLWSPIGFYYCNLCGYTWPHRRRKAVVAMGPCPGSYLWNHAIPENLSLPWLMPQEQEVPLVWRGSPVHLSHRLQFYRGCLFCRTCGARSARAMSPALVARCLLRPTSVRTQRRLRDMKRGRWPDAGSTWPQPLDALCPNFLIPFLE